MENLSDTDLDTQLFAAQAIRDVKTMVHIYLLREQYLDVLEILKKEPVTDFTYSVIPLLVEKIPMEMLKFYLKNDKLRGSKLFRTLTKSLRNLEVALPALKYLEFVITRGCQNKIIHNFYVQYCAKYRMAKFLEYLKAQGTNRENLCYDLEFAIMNAERTHSTHCICFLYCISGRYLDAVRRALTIFDYELAKSCAKMMDQSKDLFDLAEESEQLVKTRKSVWIMLAEHLIKKEDDVSTCLKILDDSGRVLSIEDIISLCPSYSTIDDFKDALFHFLETSIDTLQRYVREATETAAEIHEKNEKLMNRATIVKAGKACVICHKPLLGRIFFPHSCKNHIHRDCVISEKQQNVERNLEALLRSDCPICGAVTIDFIDKPFMMDPEFENDEATRIF